MASPDVSIGLALGADLSASAATWTYTEIGERVSRIRWRGPRRSSVVGQIDAGTLTVELDNSDGLLDPRATTGAYTSGGVSLIRPKLPVKFSARYPAGSGLYTSLGIGYRQRGQIVPSPPAVSTAIWDCPDGLSRLNVDRVATSAVGGDEKTGARIGRVLDSIGWPSADRNIDTGTTPCQATTLGGSALAELQATADTEGADLFVDGSGRVAFFARSRRLIPGSVDYAFSDTSSTMDVADVTIADNDDQLINRAVMQRVGGMKAQVDNLTSQAKFGVVARSLSNLVAADDVWVQALAEGVVYQNADWSPRITSVTLTPTVNESLYPAVLALQIGDYITVTDGGYTRNCWVEGVDHDVIALRNAVVQWVTTVYTSDFGTVASLGFGVWDTATWDTTRWAW